MLEIDDEKTELNARVKALMDVYLRSKTWVEKVESIERMNVADKIAKEAMRKTLATGSFAFGPAIQSAQVRRQRRDK